MPSHSPAPTIAPELPAALSPSRRKVVYIVLTLASLGYNFSFILIDYIRPFLVRDLGMSLQQTALLYSAQASGVILGSFNTPVLVARIGSRRGLTAATLALALATAFTLSSSAVIVWAALRFVVGLALAGAYVASMTLLANSFPPRIRGRLLALNMAMFSVALMTAGGVGSIVGAEGWRILVIIAVVVPLLVAALSLAVLPDEHAYAVYGDDDTAEPAQSHGSWREMFSGRRRWLTLCCLLLAGLNFSGYQFYSGFITTYLMNVRHFNAVVTGYFVAIDGVGTLAGSLLWGWIADRHGRRYGAIGFACVSAFIGVFLIAPRIAWLLMTLEFGYALCLSAANGWAAYFAELFPIRLRPMGTSLFHGGHVISLCAPLLVSTVAARFSLNVGMALAPITFVIAALIWWSLPETLRRSPGYRGFNPNDAALSTSYVR